MPTKKKPARKAYKNQAKRKQSQTLHPLGKAFFLTFSFTLIFAALFFKLNRNPDSKPSPQPTFRAITNPIEMQIALSRAGFSPGSIDGKLGTQTSQALVAYQTAMGIPPTGVFDLVTADKLQITDPVFARIELRDSDFRKIALKPTTWVERGQLDAMHYNSILEMVAEHAQTDPDTIVALNPNLQWNALRVGDQILVPRVPPVKIQSAIAYVRIRLSERTLQAFDADDQLRFHCPVSIARRIDKRPNGQLAVKVLVDQPNYTFNPAILAATAQREGITQKFIIQPGPNNPVGSVWIGLNLPSYGIHGTPEPEKVGRTESSGCFRLANWNAKSLLEAAWVGMPVYVVP
ncbi:MAG TPA: murein L,D-transpeptidase [Opitutae bacterium]|nr:murein L,D-transpeptidase [Opitutae bacterium]